MSGKLPNKRYIDAEIYYRELYNIFGKNSSSVKYLKKVMGLKSSKSRLTIDTDQTKIINYLINPK